MKKLNSILVLIVLLLTNYLIQCAPDSDSRDENSKKCNQMNCRLPLCRCSTTNVTEVSNNMALDDTPMMVAITFNGILTAQHSLSIKKILDPTFRNPNGCPIQATFFVSDKGRGFTDYCFVQGLFNNHNEIGVSVPRYRQVPFLFLMLCIFLFIILINNKRSIFSSIDVRTLTAKRWAITF